jgi:hypothetical protein
MLTTCKYVTAETLVNSLSRLNWSYAQYVRLCRMLGRFIHPDLTTVYSVCILPDTVISLPPSSWQSWCQSNSDVPRICDDNQSIVFINPSLFFFLSAMTGRILVFLLVVTELQAQSVDSVVRNAVDNAFNRGGTTGTPGISARRILPTGGRTTSQLIPTGTCESFSLSLYWAIFHYV